MPRLRKASRPVDPKLNLSSVSVLPRRFLIVIALAITILFIVVLSLPSSDSSTLEQIRASYKQSAGRAKQLFRNTDGLPNLYNPFATGDAAQRPSDQRGAKHKGVAWYVDEQWQKPFSSSVILDDERMVLPPLEERTPIYTYYDATGKADDVVGAEEELLLDWRRAWWAHGFRPIVLGRAHAKKKEAHWRDLQQSEAPLTIQYELARWLAWSQVGGGLLSDWVTFPMCNGSDPALKALRNGHVYDEAVKIGPLGSALLVASKEQIDATLKLAFADAAELAEAAAIDSIPGFDTFQPSTEVLNSLAIYHPEAVSSIYKSVAEKYESSKTDAILALHKVINIHLHNTWQAQYPSGVSVAKPHPQRMTTMTSSAVKIAQLLTACPQSASRKDACPPNNQKCTPCLLEDSMGMALTEASQNSSSSFEVATYPHPLTFTSLTTGIDPSRFSPRTIRRNTPRDQWLQAVTSTVVKNKKLGAQQRLSVLKELIGAPDGLQHSLWLTAERSDPSDIDWLFGFDTSVLDIADDSIKLQARLHEIQEKTKGTQLNGKSNDASQHRELEQKNLERRIARMIPSSNELARERSLIREASDFIIAKEPKQKRVREMVEAWNLADLEAWKFVRAVNMRRDKELFDYMKEEGLDPTRSLNV